MATSLDDLTASLAKFGSSIFALQQAVGDYSRGLQAYASQINSINAGPVEVKASRTSQVLGLAVRELEKLTRTFKVQLVVLQESVEVLRGVKQDETGALETKFREMQKKAVQMKSLNTNVMATVSRQGELSADLRSAGEEFIQILQQTNGVLDDFCSLAEGISAVAKV